MITQIPQSHPENPSQMLKHKLLSSRYGNKVESINMSLMKHLEGEMHNDKLVVAEQEKPFKIIKPAEQSINKADRTEMEMSQLISKKQEIQNELKKLQHQEYKLHVNQSRFGLGLSKLSQSQVTSSPQRNFRSQLTEEDKQKIRSVIRVQKKFIKQLKQKELQYYAELQNDRKKRLQAEQNLKKQKCQERKSYWERIRSEIAQRQQSRKKKFVEDQERLKEVKKSKKLYEVLEDSWNSQLSRDESLIKEATQHMRKNHKFDLAKIVEHEKEYERLVKEKQEARQQSVNEFQDRMKLTLPKIPSSKFFATIKQEERRKKEQQEEKERRKYELNQKMYRFAQRVKEDYKPKIDEAAKKLLQMSIQEEKVEKKPGLPLGEMQNLGNNYMREIHKNVALVRAARGQASKIVEKQIQPPKKPKHTNYLIELKAKRKQEGPSLISLTNQVTKIMKNTNYSATQKIQRAKLVAKRLEGKENTKSSMLINSINEKMKILKTLSED